MTPMLGGIGQFRCKDPPRAGQPGGGFLIQPSECRVSPLATLTPQ
jgi:hypothetical protein